jgi:hypothetical protein
LRDRIGLRWVIFGPPLGMLLLWLLLGLVQHIRR